MLDMSVFFSQYNNIRVRAIALDTWTASLVAGSGNIGGFNSNGVGTSASFATMAGISVDDAGKFLFIVR